MNIENTLQSIIDISTPTIINFSIPVFLWTSRIFFPVSTQNVFQNHEKSVCAQPELEEGWPFHRFVLGCLRHGTHARYCPSLVPVMAAPMGRWPLLLQWWWLRFSRRGEARLWVTEARFSSTEVAAAVLREAPGHEEPAAGKRASFSPTQSFFPLLLPPVAVRRLKTGAL